MVEAKGWWGLDRFQAALNRAVFDPAAWQDALEALAAAADCPVAHYIGWSGPAAPMVNLACGVTEDDFVTYTALGGGDPALNPLAAAGIRLPVGRQYCIDEVWPMEARRRSPLWNDFLAAGDMHHCHVIVIAREGPDHYVLNLARGADRGPLSADQRRLFADAADRWLASMRAAQAMGVHAAKLATSALDEVGIAAFVFDGVRRVVRTTTRAEELVGPAGPCRLVHRRLIGPDAATTDRLQAGLAVAIGEGGAPATASVRVEAGGRPLLFRFAPLPQASALGDESVVIAMVEDALPALTPAEMAVAEAMAAGSRPAEIAAARGVSLDTVRSQVKVIYRKMGVNNQLELLAMLQKRRP